MSTPPSSYFPLRWESTGDQWWYASPIDWAAANGHYDLVRELLHIDPNLLIKLTSLRRIRRLETVWDDDPRFLEVARCRAAVARRLLLECEGKDGGGNGLVRAGYGGWLLYTAASAGDEGFVEELLGRDPLMVFGEGEFGVTDVLYAAARSRNAKVFGVLLEHAMTPTTCSTKAPNDQFKWEMRNRALHAAARGGSLKIVKELIAGGCHADLRAFRDAHGSTVLHAASGRGQVEVVKGIIEDFDIIRTTDNQGNTSLHIAAFRGHLGVVEILISACPTSISFTNYTGNTFLHLALYGFRTPGFRRLDRQMELMKQLVSSSIISIESIINLRNNEGRTILHLAVIGNVHYNLVALLMKVPSIDLNIHDIDDMTPLDLLNRRPRTATSDLLVRQMVSAGGVLNSRNLRAQPSIGSYPRMHVSSPGTCFKISDAEIFLYAGIESLEPSGFVDRDSRRTSSCSSDSQSGLTPSDASEGNHDSADSRRRSSAASRLKSIFHWPRQKKKSKEAGTPGKSGENSLNSRKKWNEKEETPTPLRQRFSKSTSLQNNKRALAIRSFSPSPTSKKKFAAGLRHGIMETMPHLTPEMQVPITPPSRSSMASPSSDRQKGICYEIENGGPSSNSSIIEESAEKTSLRSSFSSSKLMNQYLCFGPHGLAVEDSSTSTSRRSKRSFKRSILSAA